MNIADRIQGLRKAKGISQEELADHVGVSRQAVSKWESEQSIPDIDKIILLSEYFEVTTDYILRGIENKKQETERRVDANIFVIIATVLHFIGLTVACAVWYEEQAAMAIVIGLIFLALGCMVFAVGLLGSAQDTREKARRNFWVINIWLLSFMPLSFVYNMLIARLTAPYPLLVRQVIALPIFWLVYLSLCVTVVFFQVRKKSWENRSIK